MPWYDSRIVLMSFRCGHHQGLCENRVHASHASVRLCLLEVRARSPAVRSKSHGQLRLFAIITFFVISLAVCLQASLLSHVVVQLTTFKPISRLVAARFSTANAVFLTFVHSPLSTLSTSWSWRWLPQKQTLAKAPAILCSPFNHVLLNELSECCVHHPYIY